MYKNLQKNVSAKRKKKSRGKKIQDSDTTLTPHAISCVVIALAQMN